jgi:hypothetical protein
MPFGRGCHGIFCLQARASWHCIGVDPYYLAQRAQEFGYHPKLF